MHKIPTLTLTVTAALALGAGCLTDPDDERLGDSEQAFTGHGGYVVADTTYATANLGTTTGRACFLSGLAGNVTTWTLPTGGNSAGAGVEVNGSNWRLYVEPHASGSKLSAWARCVNATGLTSAVTWSTGQAAKILAPMSGNRRCFLTEIRTARNTTYPHGGFQNSLDQVVISNDGTNWLLSGSAQGLIYATARCINVANDLGVWLNWANPGNSTVQSMALSNGAATACFLTQINGEIDDGTDWYQGLYVAFDGVDRYELRAKDGNGGRARCAN